MSDIFLNEEKNALEDTKKEKLDRKSWNVFTVRRNAAWKDDTIPADEVTVISQIGRGRFGEVIFLKLQNEKKITKVYEAYYYEPAVIKFFDMWHVDEQKRLDTFKQDTACFQNVRHENLVFFRGFYTMEQNRFGVVM